ncbi:MAG: transporter [Hyphomicrobiales bacterium]|nr:transporter [Hyphomicrobiales bacterium]
MSIRITALLGAVLAILAFGSPRLLAHEGHDHEAAPAATAQQGAPRLESASALFELVGVAQGGGLTIWLDRFETNEPVPDATIEVETPAGPQTAMAQPDGAYRIAAPWADKPGAYDLIFTVAAGGDIDMLTATLQVPRAGAQAAAPTVGGSAIYNSMSLAGAGVAGLVLGAFFSIGLRRRPLIWAPAMALLMLVAFGAVRLLAHEGHVHAEEQAAAPVMAGDRAQILADGSVFLPKPTQRVLSVRTSFGREDRYAKRTELPGRVIPDPNGSGLVQAAAAGRLSPPPGGFPRLGARVKAGDVLAFVSTPFAAIDQSTMRQQQGDLDQQISIVERRIARYETLTKTGAVAQVTLDEARLELQGLRDRRLSLERVKLETEALRAPVDGVIAAASAVAGQVVDANAVVFQIIDPDRLFVEALSFEAPRSGVAASGRTPDGRELTLSFVGSGLADRNQALPVQFAVEGSMEPLRLGQFVTVYAEMSDGMAGLAAPRASVVRRSNGETVVYTHDSAERFAARVVRTRPLDANRVLIVAGLEAGKRVVTQAAELLNQVR